MVPIITALKRIPPIKPYFLSIVNIENVAMLNANSVAIVIVLTDTELLLNRCACFRIIVICFNIKKNDQSAPGSKFYAIHL